MKPWMRAVVMFAVSIVVAVAVAGCANGGADTAALKGTWLLESFGGTGAPIPADPSLASTLTLKAGQASGSGGVNSYSGTYEASSDGKISFGPLAATTMAGPAAAMEQEAKFFAALEKARRFEFNGAKLVLGDPGNNTLLVMGAQVEARPVRQGGGQCQQGSRSGGREMV